MIYIGKIKNKRFIIYLTSNPSIILKYEVDIFSLNFRKLLEQIYNEAYFELLEPNQDAFRKKSEIEEVMKKS